MEPKNQFNKLFPMPLTSMEQFHWFDATEGFTNQVYCRIRFSGVVDPVAAQKAASIVIARHPFLKARVVEIDGKLSWQQSPELTPKIDWCEKLDESNGPRPFDRETEIPWKVVCRNDGKTTELWFYMSHVVGDGLAGVQIISDWMKCYHKQVTGDAIRGFHKLDPCALHRRNSLGLTKKSYLKHIWKQPLGLYGATKFILRKPAELQLKTTVQKKWDHLNQPAIIGDWLDEDSTRRIKTKSHGLNITTNTVLVGALMRTLEKFCLQNPKQVSPWIRVILPMNIRTFADRRMPATNRATIVQVDRQASDFSRSDFLYGLNREIKIIRDWDLGKLFLISIRFLSMIPGAIRRSAANKKCRGTAVFANLAEPFGRMGLPIENGTMQVGNLTLQDFDFVGPIRNRMPLSFTAQQHLNRTRLSLHYDPRVIESSEANEVLKVLKQNCLQIDD